MSGSGRVRRYLETVYQPLGSPHPTLTSAHPSSSLIVQEPETNYRDDNQSQGTYPNIRYTLDRLSLSSGAWVLDVGFSGAASF